ncbi:hypothetical protein [Nocardiopsis chromatogenes]|uniref:hypothetical protein n=1 Tax=Nocardiopsis chromatogenes TaxID=280239 RepID=UPI00034839C7|nr:hypothetical protein [Nocardiopsis chromatogenes]
MAKGFKINKRGIRQMSRAIEKEFARNPVQVPIEGSLGEAVLTTEYLGVYSGVGFDEVPEGATLRLAAVEATVLLLLELEERGPDERGVDPTMQFVEAHLHLLDEPLCTWAQANMRELTQALTRDHLLADTSKNFGGQVGSELSERGRRYAVVLRAQRSGRGRRVVVGERVLGLVGHADAEGWERVDPADLVNTALGWVAGVKVTEDEADAAGSDLTRRGLITATELDQGTVCFARPTSVGVTVLEAFNGSITMWEKSKAQGGTHVGDQITIRDSNGVQLATRTSGTVSQSASTEISATPDLAQLCAQIRELAPQLSLDASEREELLEQTDRLESASADPQGQVRGVKRWLSNAHDLLTGDTSGKAAGVLSALGSALVWCNELIAKLGQS